MSNRLTARLARICVSGITDTIPDVLSPRDEARLELSSRAGTLTERAATLVPVAVDPKPGDLIPQATELQALAEELLSTAVRAGSP
ncbi:hypothetical protein [Streptomyces sp. c-19]|uniref:hypothetical protein n=1 Tax=Streptomyces sp. c-19 TaxID=2789275 RepID=UPI0039806D47